MRSAFAKLLSSARKYPNKLEFLGALTGAIGALLVGGAVPEERFLGFCFFSASNFFFGWWGLRNHHWWILALQVFYTFTTIRGLWNNW